MPSTKSSLCRFLLLSFRLWLSKHSKRSEAMFSSRLRNQLKVCSHACLLRSSSNLCPCKSLCRLWSHGSTLGKTVRKFWKRVHLDFHQPKEHRLHTRVSSSSRGSPLRVSLPAITCCSTSHQEWSPPYRRQPKRRTFHWAWYKTLTLSFRLWSMKS